MPNFFVGGDPDLYANPYAGQTRGAVSQLTNSTFGAQGAQTAARGIGRRYQDQIEGIQSNPSFGRNAAVSSRLTDLAAAQAGESTADAYQAGAKVDAGARVQGAQLSLQAGEQDRADNELNYQRKQDASFGNSFLGHVLESGVGAGLGIATGGLSSALSGLGSAAASGGGGGGGPMPNFSIPTPRSNMSYFQGGEDIHDASFGKGAVKTIIGRDGTHYTPRADDGVIVGTKLGARATNTKLGAGALSLNAAPVKPKILDMPHKIQWDTYKLGSAAFDYD